LWFLKIITYFITYFIACHSGTLLHSLASNDRAIISSTDSGYAYFDENQNFTYFMVKGLSKGLNFLEAFYYANSEQKKMLSKISDYPLVAGDEIGNEIGNYFQEPQYDDTGDGIYNISKEGEWLKQFAINGNVKPADITLQVESLTESKIITVLEDVILKAKATLVSGTVNKVWATIRPPKMDIIIDNTGIPLLAFPKTNLYSSKLQKNVWEGGWNNFVYNGDYEITFYAQDNDNNIEHSSSIQLSVIDGVSCPLSASVELNISKDVYTYTDDFKISVRESLSYGYDLYIVLVMSDGQFITFDRRNKFSKKFNRPDSWWSINRSQEKDIIVMDDINLLKDYPKGQYSVFAILSPERQDVLNATSNWVIDSVSFEIK